MLVTEETVQLLEGLQLEVVPANTIPFYSSVYVRIPSSEQEGAEKLGFTKFVEDGSFPKNDMYVAPEGMEADGVATWPRAYPYGGFAPLFRPKYQDERIRVIVRGAPNSSDVRSLGLVWDSSVGYFIPTTVKASIPLERPYINIGKVFF